MAKPLLIEIKVKKGDTLIGIVKRNGFKEADWPSFYNATYNKDLKRKRPDPNLILPGDTFRIPAYKKDEIAAIKRAADISTSKLAAYRTRVKIAQSALSQLVKELKAVTPKPNPIKKRIDELQKEVEKLNQLAEDAAAECSDQWSCIGAGAAAANFNRQAGNLRKEIKKLKVSLLKANLDDAKAKLKITRQVETAHKNLNATLKEQIAFEKDLTELINFYNAASAAY